MSYGAKPARKVDRVIKVPRDERINTDWILVMKVV